MILAPLSKKSLYILIVVSLILIPAAYGIGAVFLKCSSDRNGHGIDGVGAAIISSLIFNIMIFASFGAYIIILIKVIQSILHYKDISNYLMIIPLLPIICVVAFYCYNSYTLKKEQATFSADDYAAMIEEYKFRHSHEENGEKVLDAYEYLSSEVASDSYLLIARFHFDESKRKSIVDEAIPILMKDLEGDKLCYHKYYDGTDHYLPTSIEHWEYTAETGSLVVKFVHEDETKEIKIRY